MNLRPPPRLVAGNYWFFADDYWATEFRVLLEAPSLRLGESDAGLKY